MYSHQENKLTVRSTWTRQENDIFEYSLTVIPEDISGRWEKIASYIPGKTEEDVRVHYEALVDDINAIESGRFELPSFPDDDDEFVVNRNAELRTSQISFGGSEVREKPRKKGSPWTKDEHRKFLEGLAKYGKGDWRSISRISVVTRTPTQVASHAQKYFNRLDASPKERKRSSIHDITITTMAVQPPPTNLYVAQGGPLTASSSTSLSTFYSGQEVARGTPPLPPPAQTSNFYVGQGVGRAPPPPPPPQQQQQQQMGYGYQQNFVYPY